MPEDARSGRVNDWNAIQATRINNTGGMDPALPTSRMATTPRGKEWEDAADANIVSDNSMAAREAANLSKVKFIRDMSTPEARIGALTHRYLKKGAFDFGILPEELQGLGLVKNKKADLAQLEALTSYVQQNKDIIRSLRNNPNNVTGASNWTGSDAIRRTLSGQSSALSKMYQHLDAINAAKEAGTDIPVYKGPGFSASMQVRVYPFTDKTNVMKHRQDIFDTAYNTQDPDNPAWTEAPQNMPDWLKNIPVGNPINTFKSGAIDIYGNLPEFNHIFDVMEEDLQHGRLTSQQLKSGSFSVEAAARRAAEYNAEKIKAMEQAKLVEAKGFPVIKQYDSGHKWLELKHDSNQIATQRALTEEGKAMGHCVGGYCDRVLSGNTRILSLRDPKGRPRVTVELHKNAGPYGRPIQPQHQADIDATGWPQWNITQIKGPANRKPSVAEIPMIQDFIKNNGPWGDSIGDAHNADLVHARNLSDNLRDFIYENTDPENPEPLAEDLLSRWALQTAKDQGHPYIPKQDILNKYQELGGEPIVLSGALN